MTAKGHIASIDAVCDMVKNYFPEANFELIRKAHEFAVTAHGSQKRQSGDPYMDHPREVAFLLAELHMDEPTIITGLLHDTVEDTHATLPQIEKEFGPAVAQLVDGVTKLSKITFKTSEEKQAENFRKMVIAMAKDIRVVLVKLADRTHNMRTLEHLLPYKQRSIAQETLDIYAPIAHRLGISSLKVELEDLSLRYLHPDVYYKLASKIAKTKKEREKYIDDITSQIQDRLKEYDLTGSVTGRPKHFYSIYKKMDRRNIDFDQVHDLIAFRITLDNITECYKALGVMHAAFKPVPGRFKDYIAIPKANRYQSLHTTVIASTGDRIEIQIRTHEMHAVAEYGIAAHWKYKEGRFANQQRDKVEWVDRLLEWQRDLKDPAEFLETVKTDLFEDEVYIFTPNGDVKELPHGSTPLDFAFAVHSDVGIRCVGAKVNGKIVPLKYRLKSGDAVEVLTSPTAQPSKDWLKLVKTSKAKNKIRSHIKNQERERAMSMGQEMLERELKSYSQNLKTFINNNALKTVAEKRNLKSIEELYVHIGYGRAAASTIANNLLPADVLSQAKKSAATKGEAPKAEGGFLSRVFKNATQKLSSSGHQAISVGDLDDILVRFGKCCSPIPGDPIVGFVSRGRGVTVHLSSCPKAFETDPDRKVSVQWNLQTPVKRNVRIRVLSHDLPGVLALMSQTITGCGVNISQAHIRTTKDRKAVSYFEVEVGSTEELSRVLGALESKKGVINVERLKA